MIASLMGSESCKRRSVLAMTARSLPMTLAISSCVILKFVLEPLVRVRLFDRR